MIPSGEVNRTVPGRSSMFTSVSRMDLRPHSTRTGDRVSSPHWDLTGLRQASPSSTQNNSANNPKPAITAPFPAWACEANAPTTVPSAAKAAAQANTTVSTKNRIQAMGCVTTSTTNSLSGPYQAFKSSGISSAIGSFNDNFDPRVEYNSITHRPSGLLRSRRGDRP